MIFTYLEDIWEIILKQCERGGHFMLLHLVPWCLKCIDLP